MVRFIEKNLCTEPLHSNSTKTKTIFIIIISDFLQIFHRCTIDIDLKKYEMLLKYVYSFLSYRVVKFSKIKLKAENVIFLFALEAFLIKIETGAIRTFI